MLIWGLTGNPTSGWFIPTCDCVVAVDHLLTPPPPARPSLTLRNVYARYATDLLVGREVAPGHGEEDVIVVRCAHHRPRPR
jgi:hypothetical protein